MQLVPGSDITYNYKACGYHSIFNQYTTKTNTKPVNTKYTVLMNVVQNCAIQSHYAYDPSTTGISIATQSELDAPLLAWH